MLDILEKHLTEKENKAYLVGESLTLADVLMTEFVYNQLLNPNADPLRVKLGEQTIEKAPLFKEYAENRKKDFPRL